MQSRTYDIGFKTNFEHIIPNSDNTQKFTILYTHGFCSDPWGRKPEVQHIGLTADRDGKNKPSAGPMKWAADGEEKPRSTVAEAAAA